MGKLRAARCPRCSSDHAIGIDKSYYCQGCADELQFPGKITSDIATAMGIQLSLLIPEDNFSVLLAAAIEKRGSEWKQAFTRESLGMGPERKVTKRDLTGE